MDDQENCVLFLGANGGVIRTPLQQIDEGRDNFIAIGKTRLNHRDRKFLGESKPLDNAIIRRNDGAEAFFRKGVTLVDGKVTQLDQKLSDSNDPAEQAALRRDRSRLSFYTAFDFKVVAAAVRAGLER